MGVIGHHFSLIVASKMHPFLQVFLTFWEQKTIVHPISMQSVTYLDFFFLLSTKAFSESKFLAIVLMPLVLAKIGIIL